MDFSINLIVTMLDDEYGNVSVEPSCEMERDEIIFHLEWILEALKKPHLRVVK